MSSNFGLGGLATSGLSNVGVGPLNVGNMLDTVEFVKKAWSTFGVPSNFAPTADVEEIDRRISDLKAVEQWLSVNMSMLQGTIQALEIQRGTIATLKAYAGAFGTSAALPGSDLFARALAGSSAAAAPKASTASATTGERGAWPPPSADDETPGGDAGAAQPGSAAQQRDATQHGDAARLADDASQHTRKEPAANPAPALDPTAWWNLLQSQFNQIARAAMSGVGLASQGAEQAPTRSRSPATKRASSGDARASAKGAPVARTKKTRPQRSRAKPADDRAAVSAGSGAAGNPSRARKRPKGG